MALSPLYLAKHTGKEIDDAVDKVQLVLSSVTKAPYVKPDGGIPNTDLTTAAQNSLKAADTAVQPAAMNTAIEDAIGALDVTDTPVAGRYVSGVSEVDGKIAVTRADLPERYDDTEVKGLVAANTTAIEKNAGDITALGAKVDAIKVPTKTSELINDGAAVEEGQESSPFASVKFVQDTLEAATGGESAADVAAALKAHEENAKAHGIDVVKSDVATLKTEMTAAQGDITNLQTDLGTLQTTVTDNAAAAQKYTDDEIAKLVGGKDLNEAFDTLKEVSDYLATHQGEATNMLSDINTNKENIATLQTGLAAVKATADAAATQTALEALVARVAALETLLSNDEYDIMLVKKAVTTEPAE